MKEKTCCFIGHRNAVLSAEIIKKITDYVTYLIEKEHVTLFLFGHRSDFDMTCRHILSDIQEKYPHIRLVAYICNHESFYYSREEHKIYSTCMDETYFHKTSDVAGKATYSERNEQIINASDFCIFYYDENYTLTQIDKKTLPVYTRKSGTKRAFEYATKKGKTIINFFSSCSDV